MYHCQPLAECLYCPTRAVTQRACNRRFIEKISPTRCEHDGNYSPLPIPRPWYRSISQPPIWGRLKGVVPICSVFFDSFRFALFVSGNAPICSNLLRFISMCSDLFQNILRLVPICFQNKSGKPFSADPFCKSPTISGRSRRLELGLAWEMGENWPENGSKVDFQAFLLYQVHGTANRCEWFWIRDEQTWAIAKRRFLINTSREQIQN